VNSTNICNTSLYSNCYFSLLERAAQNGHTGRLLLEGTSQVDSVLTRQGTGDLYTRAWQVHRTELLLLSVIIVLMWAPDLCTAAVCIGTVATRWDAFLEKHTGHYSVLWYRPDFEEKIWKFGGEIFMSLLPDLEEASWGLQILRWHKLNETTL